MFTTVFGSTTYAVSVVISVFMGGLALGSWAFGRLADRARRHLLILALLEGGIAVSALVVPHALKAAEGLYGVVFRSFGSAPLLTGVQVLASALILLAPTFLMGATLPVLSRHVAGRWGKVGPAVGLLYGLNTLGAAGGAFLTGFVLIKHLGTLRTIHLAAGVNLALGAAFLLLHGLSRGPAAEPERGTGEREEADEPLDRLRVRMLLGMVALSGFVAFSYEVLWTRLLTFKFESTVYAFSIMLATFLLGLGLGGAVVGLLRRTPARARYWRIYAQLELLIGICGLATILLFLAGRQEYSSFATRVAGEFGTAMLVMLVPTTLMGAAFPIACHLYAAGVRSTGRSVGSIYVFNTLGAIGGALATGFLLVRVLGTQGSLTAVSFLMVLGASAVLATSPPERPAAGRRPARVLLPIAIGWAGALAVWGLTPPGLLQDFFLGTQRIAFMNPETEVSLLGYAEGVEGVAVVAQTEDGHRTLATGSTDVAGTFFTLRNTQKLQAHVPMLAHPDPRDVCQVGFGSGETAHIFSS
ncbi:MAG: fused MFS/spermidine synthase, partial [Planctomycetota bacterium]